LRVAEFFFSSEQKLNSEGITMKGIFLHFFRNDQPFFWPNSAIWLKETSK
jgi:hypothetical protein